jgi:hypothetical protein
MNGTVRSDISDVTVDEEDHGSRYSARIGAGGAPITLTGINGNVRLTRADNSVASSAASEKKPAAENEKAKAVTDSKSGKNSQQ